MEFGKLGSANVSGTVLVSFLQEYRNCYHEISFSPVATVAFLVTKSVSNILTTFERSLKQNARGDALY